MASVANLEKKLLEIINTEDSFAIALTGEWGIGKTYFWKIFCEKHRENFMVNKIAYVSLFGIDSLDALKLEIAIKSYSTSQSSDNLSGIKKVFQNTIEAVDLPKIEGSGIALSLSKSMITSTISNMVNETLICIDDIERISDKLDIKDVMGLVNHLNLEKKCKVIVLLHEGEADKKFHEYKEKVFDEVLTLSESITIIKKDIVDDDDLFPVYELFYHTLNIKNLRFYQRVQSTFKIIIDNSDSELSLVSKKQILEFLLVIMFAHDMPKSLGSEIDFESFITILDEKNPVFSDRLIDLKSSSSETSSKEDLHTLKQFEKLNEIRTIIDPFISNFIISGWGHFVVSLVRDLDLNSDMAKLLNEKDTINERILEDSRLKIQVLQEFHNLDIKPKFPERLYYVACSSLSSEQLSNLSFYCDILETSNRSDLAAQLEDHIKRYIEQSIRSSKSHMSIDDFYFFGRKPEDRFYNFTVNSIASFRTNSFSSNKILSIFLDFHKHNRRAWNSSDKDLLKLIDKDILRQVIWADIESNQRYRKLFVHSILLHPCLGDINGKREEIRLWILDLLRENIVDNPNNEPSIKMWLDNTNNLTENLT